MVFGLYSICCFANYGKIKWVIYELQGLYILKVENDVAEILGINFFEIN